MARKKIVVIVPSSFDLWLACEMLDKSTLYMSQIELYAIIGGYVMNKVIDRRMLLKLRKAWFQIITLGLTEEEQNELVNK